MSCHEEDRNTALNKTTSLIPLGPAKLSEHMMGLGSTASPQTSLEDSIFLSLWLIELSIAGHQRQILQMWIYFNFPIP